MADLRPLGQLGRRATMTTKRGPLQTHQDETITLKVSTKYLGSAVRHHRMAEGGVRVHCGKKSHLSIRMREREELPRRCLTDPRRRCYNRGGLLRTGAIRVRAQSHTHPSIGASMFLDDALL